MVNPDTTASEAPLLAGRYRLVGRRGNSIDITLFEAVDEQLHRPVAVKIVSPDISADPLVQRSFRRMMDQVAAVQHPHLVAVHEWGTVLWNGQEVLYIVTEHLGGGSLRDLIDRGRLLSPSQALMVGLDVCKGLDMLHRHGIVHGDIRPANLVFGEDRRLRIVDAGLAPLIDEAIGGPPGRINDVAKYCSPEVARGLPAVPQSDVYALALTLLESLTGVVPFAADSTVATLANRVDKLLPVSADFGPLASVLERAGRPEATDRYTAAELGRAFVHAAERMPRPAALPLLTTTLFGADTVLPGQPVDPTGPIVRPDAATPPVPIAPPAPGTAVPPPPPPPPPPGAPSSAPTAPLAPVAAPVAPIATAAAEVEAVDEFPEKREPASGRKWLILLLALMAIGGGALAWYNTRPQHRTVPSVAGMQQGQALNQLAGDFAATVTTEASDTVAAGLVIRTDPAAGAQVKKGAAVSVVVSSGPAPRALPELTGLTVEEATTKLEGMGLVAVVGKPTFDENIAKGIVISWTVPASPAAVAGTTVVKGTKVKLVVSGGPAPRIVPVLKGQNLTVAAAKLKELQLVLKVDPTARFDPKVPANHIILSTPAAGASVPRGTTVTVVMSKGPDLVAVPNPRTVSTDAALRALLVKAGFAIGKVTGSTGKYPPKLTVNGVPIHITQKFPRGTKVDLTYPA